MSTVSVDLGPRSYAIEIGAGLSTRVGPLIAARADGRTVFLVTDEHVGPLHAANVAESLGAAGFRVVAETLPAGEQTKALRFLSQLYDRLVSVHADRKTVVVALGGGVIGDLAGLAAATFNRGLPFVQVPTTLLAMVDASVGGKVAVDHPGGKNLIGAFHQPRLVVCDLSLLATLPERDYRSGLAEVVKYGVIMDEPFFDSLVADVDSLNARAAATLERIVTRSCQLKADVVSKDEFELTGLRSILNYGHTFAHALETAEGYGGLLHGEAVSIGMMAAARLAEKLGRVGPDLRQRQGDLLNRLGLPTTPPPRLLAADLIDIMKRDKKAAAGRVNFVLPTRLGHVELVRDVEPALAIESLHDLGN